MIKRGECEIGVVQGTDDLSILPDARESMSLVEEKEGMKQQNVAENGNP